MDRRRGPGRGEALQHIEQRLTLDYMDATTLRRRGSVYSQPATQGRLGSVSVSRIRLDGNRDGNDGSHQRPAATVNNHAPSQILS